MTSYLQTGMVQGGAATLADFEAFRDLFIGIEGIFDFLPGAPWLEMYGQTLNTSDYPKLAAKRGVTGSTFVLPDMRGRVVAGYDAMGGTVAGRLTNLAGGVDGATLRAAGGSQVHTLSTAQMPKHKHSVSVSGTALTRTRAEYALVSGGERIASVNGQNLPSSSPDPTNLSLTTSESEIGTGQAHNNVQPTIIQYICILAE
jgi:microcystin-dependent protein